MAIVKRFLLLMVLVSVTGSLHAKELLTIVINKGSDSPTSIAVVPFQWNPIKAPPIDVADVISENLKLSGLFSTLSSSDMITKPHSPEGIFPNDWKRLGVQYVVMGQVSFTQGSSTSFDVRYFLYDVGNQKLLFDATTSGRYLDRVANEVSDQIYKRLTGVNGFFSTKLVYITTHTGPDGKLVYRLQQADANGRNVKTILTSADPILSPAWSPDGKKLAYVSFQDDKPNIYMQDRKTGKQTLISSFSGINGAPDFSPDGKKLALVLSKDGNPEIYILDLRTKQFQRMTHNFGIDTEPRWAPDGKSLIFTSNRGGSPQIYRLNLHDRKVTRLTFEGRYNARGQLTADGEHLVFVHQTVSKDFHIAAMNLATGLMHSLTKTELDESPSIAPNGSMIVYATKSGSDRVLRMVTIDGAIEMEVPARQGQLREPAWSPFLK